ncbi:MAG TPA: hypothetical protein VL358_01060 [Caulobacteraceae bacterium]|jgi:hypothetical protein|nr:hypothetical protein [Caulobacteraceae bacterium]
MARIKARDMRAIAFCIATIALVMAAAFQLFGSWLPTGASTAAYAVWILTRARMIRVYRRLGGESVERSSYYRN